MFIGEKHQCFPTIWTQWSMQMTVTLVQAILPGFTGAGVIL